MSKIISYEIKESIVNFYMKKPISLDIVAKHFSLDLHDINRYSSHANTEVSDRLTSIATVERSA